MYILHIETATKICSVAISQNDSLIDCYDHGEGMNHTAQLSPMIDQILKANGLKINELGAVCLSSGPGSYTGLRVGGSTAKAFAYTLGIPLVSVSTLESLASAASEIYGEASHFFPMIDARRDEVYGSLYSQKLENIWPEQSIKVNAEYLKENFIGKEDVICCGDGAFKIKPYLDLLPSLKLDDRIQCSARHLVRPGYTKLIAGRVEDPMHFTPFYMKPPNITQPKNFI
jgi:tRNA threonylcarbamoyladenosine biosynthesis protein TsaB